MPKIRGIKPELVAFQSHHLAANLIHPDGIGSQFNRLSEKCDLIAFAGPHGRALEDAPDAAQLLRSGQLPCNGAVGLAHGQRPSVAGLNGYQHVGIPGAHSNPDARANVVSIASLARYVDASLPEEEAAELVVKAIQSHATNHTGEVA